MNAGGTMTEVIRNSKNKKVAEVDKDTQTIVIKQSECTTRLHFNEQGKLEIENTIQLVR